MTAPLRRRAGHESTCRGRIEAAIIDGQWGSECVDEGADGPRRQSTLRKISVPFVPPKPNEFDNAPSIAIFRATFGT